MAESEEDNVDDEINLESLKALKEVFDVSAGPAAGCGCAREAAAPAARRNRACGAARPPTRRRRHRPALRCPARAPPGG
jgi:hypothetical protein